MFGPSFGQQSYNYMPNNGEYNNAWGSQVNGPNHHQQRRGHYDDYYRGNDKHGYDKVNIYPFNE